jgi:hypothetical protein
VRHFFRIGGAACAPYFTDEALACEVRHGAGGPCRGAIVPGAV